MDCGIIDACCESADCLEICMECCSLCFSSWGPQPPPQGGKVDVCYTPTSPGTTLTKVLSERRSTSSSLCCLCSLVYTILAGLVGSTICPMFLTRFAHQNMLRAVSCELFPLLLTGLDFAVGLLLHSWMYGADWVPAMVHNCMPGSADRASGPSQNKLLSQWSLLCRLSDWSSPSMKNDLQRQMREWLHLTGF